MTNKVIKTTTGLNVRQEFKDKLLEKKPDNMTDTAFYECSVDYLTMVESGFDKFLKTASTAYTAGLKEAAKDALKEKYEGDLEAIEIKYA